MANSLSKVEQIAWEHACEAFENLNVHAANADVFKPDSPGSALSGQTQRIPYAYQLETSTGLSTSATDAGGLTVPISLAETDIKNGSFALTVNESRRPQEVEKNVDAAVRKISSDISKEISDLIVDRGALAAGFASDLTTFEHHNIASVLLDEVGATGTDRFMYAPSRSYGKIANELASRATEYSYGVYTKGQVPMIDDFAVFKASTVKQVGTESVTTVTVNGADQDKDPIAYNSDGGYGADETDDIRTQVLTVTNTSGSLTDGDVFKIAGVNRVNIDTKEDTGQPATFRVVSGGGGTSVTISPAIVASGRYQNVSAAPANAAAITALNDNASSVSPTVFTTKDAIKLYCDELDWDAMEGSAGTVLGTYVTDSGIQVGFLKQGDIMTGSVNYRLSAWCKPNLVDPLKCGIILPNVTTAF